MADIPHGRNTDISQVPTRMRHDAEIVEKYIAEAGRVKIPPMIKQPEADIHDSKEKEKYPINGKPGCVLIMSNGFLERPKRNGRRENASNEDIKKMAILWRDDVKCELFDIRKSSTLSSSSNKMFDDKIERREALREKLKKKMGSGEVKPYENVTAEEMKELLKSFSEIKEDYAYVVVVVSTHGALVTETWITQQETLNKPAASDPSNDEVKRSKKAFEKYIKERTKNPDKKESLTEVFFGEDCKPVREEKMMKLFYNDKNQHLAGIPKFFILDYCRSEPQSQNDQQNTVQKKGLPSGKGPTVEPKNTLPVMSDMVTVYATHHKYDAFDEKTGSWLISAIAEVFGGFYERRDLLDMLTKVNEKVKKQSEKLKGVDKAMSIFESSLVKRFHLWEEKQVDDGISPSKRQKL